MKKNKVGRPKGSIKNNRLKPLMIYISEKAHSFLNEMAKEKQTSKSDIVRRMIDEQI